jgi:putative transposase
MPRAARLDHPGAFHHVIARGIERRAIFVSDDERAEFLDRLSTRVANTGAGLYAWGLMPNHLHLFVSTGTLPLSRFMQGLLGGYVEFFNQRHRRSGHLFQNRFKSTLVEQEHYGLRLVRYIHLNPVRSGLGVSLDELDGYPWTGHAVLLGHRSLAAQNVDFVLQQFGTTVGAARDAYRVFVRAAAGERGSDLDGGGLRRSAAGWEAVGRLGRGRERWAYDERILGRGRFVESVLADVPAIAVVGVCAAERERWVACLVECVCQEFGLSAAELSRGRSRNAAAARAVLSHVAVRRGGLSLAVVARALGVCPSTIHRAAGRGARIGASRNFVFPAPRPQSARSS